MAAQTQNLKWKSFYEHTDLIEAIRRIEQPEMLRNYRLVVTDTTITYYEASDIYIAEVAPDGSVAITKNGELQKDELIPGEDNTTFVTYRDESLYHLEGAVHQFFDAVELLSKLDEIEAEEN